MELGYMYLTPSMCLTLGSIFVPSVPHVSISSVIGCEAQIEALRSAILLPLRYPSIYKRRGAKWTGIYIQISGLSKTGLVLAINYFHF